MKNIHGSTTLGMILNFGAIACLFLGFDLVAGILAIVAYFASIKEVSKYTSWYQFANVFSAALLIGYSIDHTRDMLPLFAGLMLIVALGSIFRIVWFSFFGYTGQ